MVVYPYRPHDPAPRRLKRGGAASAGAERCEKGARWGLNKAPPCYYAGAVLPLIFRVHIIETLSEKRDSK